MEHTEDTLGIVYWNTLYRADPTEQLHHLERLRGRMYGLGVTKAIMCLSEVTLGEGGLREKLGEEGYDVVWAQSGISHAKRVLKQPYNEAIAIVSPDMPVETYPRRQTLLHRQIGAAGIKDRRLLRVDVPGTLLTIHNAHLSYLHPRRQEITGLLRQLTTERMRTLRDEQIIGGDFNTVRSKQIVRGFESKNYRKLRPANGTATFPLLGLELDHVFASQNIADQCTVEIGDKGPSNHRPLLVFVEK